ncbi:MAG: NAD(P)/FAD-dependent oxidoreductase [Xanthobacteraceae bacterium]|nr:NAD(P)/FAD-dependent oxidoreductase [Xanthobacteraceae bacterium]
MASDDVEVVIIGGGAAGVAAARRLHDAAISCLLVEARSRLGGRAFSVGDGSGHALDLGCGWLHSADRNPWCGIATKQGATFEKSPPPWSRSPLEVGFPRPAQTEFQDAMTSFFERLERLAQHEPDVAAAAALEPGNRWNGLINALGTYISGAEWDRVSAKDYDRYADSGVNWRVVEGLGTIVAAYGANLPVMLDCQVRVVHHRGRRLRIETSKGAIAADQAVVAVPTTLLATERPSFTPALPQKTRAAQGLPLGLDDKLFLALDRAEEFDQDVRVFGHTDRAATAAYHFRPFGRPMIEAYFGGKCAAELEAQGENAFFDFAVSELRDVFGNEFGRRLKPIRIHRWGLDPLALGSYSFALPGSADCRATLAAPVDNRLFFAGEACSPNDFSTAHGAWQSGVTAADQVIAARRKAANLISI